MIIKHPTERELEEKKIYRQKYYQKNKAKIQAYQRNYYQKFLKKKNKKPIRTSWKGEKMKEGIKFTEGNFIIKFD